MNKMAPIQLQAFGVNLKSLMQNAAAAGAAAAAASAASAAASAGCILSCRYTGARSAPLELHNKYMHQKQQQEQQLQQQQQQQQQLQQKQHLDTTRGNFFRFSDLPSPHVHYPPNSTT